MTYIENTTGRLESRSMDGAFAIDFHNTDRITVGYIKNYEFLPRPFPIATNVVLPVGGYDFSIANASFTFGPLRRVSGSLSAEHGTFYNGHKTAFGVAAGRVNFFAKVLDTAHGFH